MIQFLTFQTDRRVDYEDLRYVCVYLYYTITYDKVKNNMGVIDTV